MSTTPVRATAPTSPARRAAYEAEGLWGHPQHLGAIESWARREPDRVAVTDPHGSFTYAELADSVARAQAWFDGHGVGPGDAVVGVLPNWFESVALYHALHRCGAVPVPLSTHARTAELEHVVRATGARVLVAPPSHLDLAAGLAAAGGIDHVGCLQPVEHAADATELRGPGKAAGSAARPGDIALVLYTSGSTAAPKGAIHTHDTLAVANRNLTWALGLDEADVHYVVAPIAHIGGLMHALHMPFENGARVVLDDRWEPARAAERVVAEGATFLGGAPVFPEGLVDAFAGGRGSPLRVVCTGGAWIPDALGEGVRAVLGARLARSYGSTECPFVSGSLPTDGPQACDADDGALMPGVEARIGGGDQVHGPVADGELHLRAACQMQGYVDEVQNETALHDGWFATGDVVSLTNGRVRVVGRMKAIAIRNGENISLDEVERALDDWTGAAAVATFVLPDQQTGERVAVAVVPRKGVAPSYEGMVAHLADRAMARQKFPEQLVTWDVLPRTASGKVDRRALASGASSRPSSVAPRLQQDGR